MQLNHGSLLIAKQQGSVLDVWNAVKRNSGECFNARILLAKLVIRHVNFGTLSAHTRTLENAAFH